MFILIFYILTIFYLFLRRACNLHGAVCIHYSIKARIEYFLKFYFKQAYLSNFYGQGIDINQNNETFNNPCTYLNINMLGARFSPGATPTLVLAPERRELVPGHVFSTALIKACIQTLVFSHLINRTIKYLMYFTIIKLQLKDIQSPYDEVPNCSLKINFTAFRLTLLTYMIPPTEGGQVT